MLTMRQWTSIAISVAISNIILLLLGFVSNDPQGGMIFALQLSAIAVFTMFLAFKLLPWNAAWSAVLPTALVIAFAVPTLALASHHAEAPLFAFLVKFYFSAAGLLFVGPMFLLTCFLLRWGTRERRTNR